MKAMTLRMPQAFRRFTRDRRGVSAVEFAILAPVMVGLYLGCAEVAGGISVDRKVSLTAAALANLTSQVATISSTDMINILDASTAIIAPYSAANLKMTVSCLNIDAAKKITVKWTVNRNGTPLLASAVAVPPALIVASSQLIFAEVSYAYTPTVGYTIAGVLNLSDKMYMSPRIQAPSYPDATKPCS